MERIIRSDLNADMTEPPESDDVIALEDFLPYRLARAAEDVSLRFAALYRARYGMTRPEWRTLATIGQKGTTTARDIGRHSGMHKTKVSRAVTALEGRRWVVRATDPDDGRVERLELTREGKRCYSDLVRIARDFEEKLVAALGPDAAREMSNGLTAIETMAGRRAT